MLCKLHEFSPAFLELGFDNRYVRVDSRVEMVWSV